MMYMIIEKVYRTNPLEVLVLPLAGGNGEPDGGQAVWLTKRDNPQGLNTTKPLLCRTYRQALQLEELMNQELFPECEMELMEGDLEAVLRELDGCTKAEEVNGGEPAESDYCGLICNASELIELGLEHRIRAIFTQEEMVPAAGMGFGQCVEIGDGESADQQAEGRSADEAVFAEIELRAELAFMDRIAELDGCAAEGGEEGGESPDGEAIAMITSVYAETDGDSLELWALYYDEESGQWWTDWIAAEASEPEAVAAAFAEQIRSGGSWRDED